MKKLVMALATVLLCFGIVATRLWMQLGDARAQNTALQARVSASEAMRAAALKSAMSAAAADARSPAPQVAGAPTTPETPRQPAARSTEALIAGVRQMMAGPEGREMLRTSLRMSMPQRYPDLGKELNLSPEELNKFFDLLARQQSELTSSLADQEGGEPRDAAAMREANRKLMERQQANNAELTAALGDKYPQWQDYQKTLPTRQQVTQLQGALGSGDNALSDAQGKALLTALAAEQARINQEPRTPQAPVRPGDTQAMLQQQMDRTAENNRRLLDAASTQLSPQQLDSYRQMLEREQNMTRMLMNTMNQQGKSP